MNLEGVKAKFLGHDITQVEKGRLYSVYKFAAPNTGNYSQQWIVGDGYLMVTGDCYAAMYNFRQHPLTLEFLASLDIDYFVSKCVADKDGSSQSSFDAQKATDRLLEIAIENWYSDYLEDRFGRKEWDAMSVQERWDAGFAEYVEDGGDETLNMESDCFCPEGENHCWHLLLNEGENKLIFGEVDYTELDVTSFTFVPQMHLAALKVAFEKFGKVF